jgi:hypothetical protein
MRSDLNLYRVTVTQEWTAEGTALVWAPDQKTAEKWAKQRVEFDPFDLDAADIYSHAKPEPLDEEVTDRMDDDDLWLILPDGEVCDNDRAGLAKFQSLLDPERLETLRLARIEAGNGQMALLEVEG